MSLRLLFALLGRSMLALLLLLHPCLRPALAGAEPANACCGSPAEPTPHACCCDVGAEVPGLPAMAAICCDAGQLPPYVPGPSGYHKPSFERVDLATAVWATPSSWVPVASTRPAALVLAIHGPPGAGLRHHLRVHVLLI